MIGLNEVVQAITERDLKLYRIATGIRIEGNCPTEFVDAIRHHQHTLLPYIRTAPEDLEQPPLHHSATNCDQIRSMLDDFAVRIVERYPWVSSDYTEQCFDDRLTKAVDSQIPQKVAEEIAALEEELNAIGLATHLFPSAMEAEARHAAENCSPPMEDESGPF